MSNQYSLRALLSVCGRCSFGLTRPKQKCPRHTKQREDLGWVNPMSIFDEGGGAVFVFWFLVSSKV